VWIVAGSRKEIVMRYVLFVLATLGMILLSSFMPPASAQVRVSVGYLDNQHGGQPPLEDRPRFSSFEGGFGQLVIGTIQSSISSPSLDPVDSGVIKIDNIGTGPVTIDFVEVVTQVGGPPNLCPANGRFRIWEDPSLPLHLPISLIPQGPIPVFRPASSLVLLQTANFNFDSSDCGLGQPNPVVIGKIKDGPQFTCVDLTGVLLGDKDAGAQGENESTPFSVIPCLFGP
jgi:hypothetical protein